MSITINRSIDAEDAVRLTLSEYMTAYCAPLPAKFEMPCILVQTTGGDSEHTSAGQGKVDTFMVVIDARAKTEDEAMTTLRNAVGILETAGGSHGLSYVEVNSLYSWGADPVRPDIAMCSATLLIKAHRETVTIA